MLRCLQAGLVALLLVLAGPAVAAEKRVALVIGNANYAHQTVLKAPSNDARLVAKTLPEIGFTDVVEYHNLDMAAFASALDKFAALARTADWALIYYAGHAVEIGEAFYLLPTDANIKTALDLDKGGISLGRVLAADTRPRLLTLVILDTPRIDPFLSAVTPSSLSKWPQWDGDLFVAFATQPKSGLVPSPGENGPFASALAQRIPTPGLDIKAIFNQIRKDVMQATGGRQITWDSLPSRVATSSSCPTSDTTPAAAASIATG
jgi:uncharacterized caspase-like protein